MVTKPAYIKSLSTAVRTLRRFYPDGSRDAISLDEAYIAAGRDLSKLEGNRLWIGKKLATLRHYGLVKPVYANDGHHRLEGMRLTKAGKDALERVKKGGVVESPVAKPASPSRDAYVENIMENIDKLNKLYPGWKASFTLSPRQKEDG